MAKKNRRKAESTPVTEQVPVQEAVVDAAAAKQQSAQPKQSARAVAISLAEEQRKLRMGIVLGVVFFIALSLSPIGSIKGLAMVSMIVAVAVLFAKGENFCANLSWPAIFVLLYVLMDTISTFYALAGKFALTEFLKVITGLAVFVIILCFEKRQEAARGFRTATMVEVALAIASFISVDLVSTRIFSSIVTTLFGSVNQLYIHLQGTGSNRIQTLFENPNVFGGCAGLAVLLSLGLLSAEENIKTRRIHLACLLITSTAFILAFSRASAGMIAIAFLVYLFLERGEKRVKALVVMVETLIFALIASVPTLMTAAEKWNGLNPVPLLLLVGATAIFIIIDEKLGSKIVVSLSKHEKATILVPCGFLAAVAIFAVLALNITTGADLEAGERYDRMAALAPGSYSLNVESTGNISLTVFSQTREEAFMKTNTELYNGDVNGVTFTVPEGSLVTTFQFITESGCTLDQVSYAGAERGKLKLDYVLFPSALITRTIGMFYSSNFQERLMLFEDAGKLFSRQPIYGLGLGSFENALASVQEFHYETKYVHNHYLQCLVDTGAIGLILFLGILLSSALALIMMWRRGKDGMHPLTPALFAALMFSALHALLEVVYSASFYLPIVFAVFALIAVCCGEAVPIHIPSGKKHHIFLWAYVGTLALWIVLLGLNIYAKSISLQPSYNALVTATALDRYERNDYMLTYVYHMSNEEERPPEAETQLYEYLDRLEQVNSNTIPLYLGECYFKLGQPSKAFDMLRKFTAYTASDEEKWDAAYRQAAQYFQESDEYIAGLTALVKDMQAWNDSHLGNIALQQDIVNFLVSTLDTTEQRK